MKLLSKIFRLRATASGALPSTRETLSAVLTARQIETLSASTPDRRDLARNAALLLGIPEDNLLRDIAARLRLSFIQRIQPIDLEAFSSMSAEELRAAGAIPQIVDGRFEGMVCVDPSALDPYRERFPAAPLCLGTWSQISAAITQSERLLSEKKEAAAAAARAAERDTSRRVLGVIAAEVHSYGAGSFEIGHDAGRLTYRFSPLGSASSARGTIHASIADGVSKLLEESAGSSLVCDLGSTGERCRLTVAVRESSGWAVTIELTLRALPVRELPPPARKIPQAAETASASGPSGSIVLLEDNISFARVLERFFKRFGIAVHHFADGGEVLSLLEQGALTADLVICDVHMPKMSGPEVLAALRALPGWSALPVIMLTSDEELDTEIKLLEAGADAFVAKSSDPRVLHAHVKRLLARKPVANAA